jgi:O-antigen/teichoic acid export membrane protein
MHTSSETEEKSNTFKKRVITAGIWSAGSHILSQAIRLGSNLIMTRLLVPEYFGLMAIANVFIFGLVMLSDMGLRQSLIQSKRFDESFINTIWTLQVLRGCLIWILSLLLALGVYSLNLVDIWPKDSVYRDELLPYILAVIGFNSVIGGFESTKLATSSRELSLAKNVAIGLISQIIALIVMIVWALIDKSVWALVVASLVASTVSTTLSHLMFLGVKNRFHWDKAAFEQIFHFGKWIFVTSILGFLLSSSDRLLLGGLVDAATLGLYAIAFFMVGSLRDLLGNVIHSVGFPALSESYRNNPASLKDVYYKLRMPFDVVSTLGSGFLFATGSLIVGLLYDSRYAGAGWILQILAVSVFELRYRLSGECFMAMGKPRLVTNLIILDLIVLYILGYLAFSYYGFKGAVWAVAISAISTIPLNLYYQHKFGVLDWRRELMALPLLPVGYGMGLLVIYFFTLIR